MRALRAGLIAALVALAAVPQAAAAGTVARAAPAGLKAPSSYDRPPPGRRMTGAQVLRVAAATKAFREERARHPGAYARSWLAGPGAWQASLYAPPPRGETRAPQVAQVRVRDRDGRVLEAWTGVQVGWIMARGYPGAFGGISSAWWIWVPLCALFALPFLRPPWRLFHLDLAVLLAFSISYAFFNHADLDVSVPSVYPLLAYLLVRMLVTAARPPARTQPLRLLLSRDALLLATGALVAFRIGLNLATPAVIDVGYSGVVGADRIAGGHPLYGAFPPADPHGDTYGPVAYLAYVPFELALPWSGRWDGLPAAHAAAIAFDLGCVAALLVLGRRLRLGALLAYLWASYPFTTMVLNSGSNDALVALLLIGALIAAERPAARTALVALAGLAKLAPLALLPLFATGRGLRPTLRAALAAGVAGALALAPVAAAGELDGLWQRAVRFQATRDSPFSIYGLYGGLGGLQLAVQIAAVALALAVVVWPKRRDIPALAAAVLIALQLGVEHWFYLYLVWFVPLVLVALLAPYREGAARRTGSIESARRPAPPRMTTALSHGSSSAAS